MLNFIKPTGALLLALIYFLQSFAPLYAQASSQEGFLTITKTSTNKKFYVNPNAILKVVTNTGRKIKGKFKIVNASTIEIKGEQVYIEQITALTSENNTKLPGTLFLSMVTGTLVVGVFYLLKSSEILEVLLGLVTVPIVALFAAGTIAWAVSHKYYDFSEGDFTLGIDSDPDKF